MLIFALALSLFVGCSDKNNDGSTPVDKEVKPETTESEAADAGTEASKVNVYGWEVPEETATLSFYYGQENPDKLAEIYTVMKAYLLKEFNLGLDIIAFENDVSERLSLMLIQKACR